MNREQPARGVRLPEFLRLVVGLAGIVYQQVVGPVNLYLLVAFMLLTGGQGALWVVELIRRWPTQPASPPVLPESSTGAGSATGTSPGGGDP